MSFNQKNMGLLLIGFSIVLVIILIFVKINMDSRGAFLCEVVSESPHLDMSECPAHQDNASWLIVGAFGVTFLVLGAGIYMIFMPSKREGQGPKKVDISKMDKEEKKIYDILNQNEGSMYQSDIIKETGLSKVSVTRILDKMEGKKLLERKRRGMTNIVLLK